MRLNLGLLALLTPFGIVLSVTPAHACSCMPSGPACQAYWSTPAVFDGTVVSVGPVEVEERLAGRPSQISFRRITLDVHQSWKGASTGRLEITTAPDGGMCGYSFKEGERYLVFAHHAKDGQLQASICSLTQPYSRAAPTLEFLASLEAPARGGRVFGTVRTGSATFDPERPRPVSETRTVVRLFGGDQERSSVSAGGRYEFAGLPPGSYRVEIDVPKGYTTYTTGQDVQLPNDRACAEANYSFAPAGRITGHLLGQNGEPLPGLRVEVTLPDARPHPDYGLSIQAASTNAQGFFEIAQLPPGRYIVGVNLKDLPSRNNPYARTVYPGASSDPHVIELALGQTVDLGTWHVPPPLPVVRIAGIVTLPDGTSVAGVYVGAWDRTGNPVEWARGVGGATSGQDGRFVLELRKGRIYTFSVRDRQSRLLRVSAPRIDTGERLPELIRIVVSNDPRS